MYIVKYSAPDHMAETHSLKYLALVHMAEMHELVSAPPPY